MNREDPGKGPGRERTDQAWFWPVILVAVIVWSWLSFGGWQEETPEISYSEFRTQLENGNISAIEVQGTRVEGLLKKVPESWEEEKLGDDNRFITFLPSFGDEKLLPLLRNQEVELKVRPESSFSWWLILVNLLPLLFFLGLIYFFFRMSRMQGRGLLNFGKSRAKLYEREEEKTTFDDVAGAKGAKTELNEIIAFLEDPLRFQRLGGVIPRGVLLVGPPGTGKTLLARAVAGEAGVPFFSITGSDFMEMFVGVGASRVRRLFQDAKKNAPSIVFIDELDSIGRRRGAGLGGGHDEREQTLNQLLSEMDGFQRNEGVIIMAATNRPDILDPALLRPGRFDRRVTVDLPTLREREQILEIHAKGKSLSETVDLNRTAKSTPGFSGADLANLLNEAALLAAREKKQEIDEAALSEAKDKVLLGVARESLVLRDEEKRSLAYHEAGHAVVGAALLGVETIHKISIVPRGKAMGVTQQFPDGDRYLQVRDDLMKRLALLLGGRASEELVFGEVSTGAEDDLKKATHLARKMILDWGMSQRLGWAAFGDGSQDVFLGREIAQGRQYSETTAREIDEEIAEILEIARDQARTTLQNQRDSLDKLARLLFEEEELSGERLVELLQ
jgi:cell division protease FtsH